MNPFFYHPKGIYFDLNFDKISTLETFLFLKISGVFNKMETSLH